MLFTDSCNDMWDCSSKEGDNYEGGSDSSDDEYQHNKLKYELMQKVATSLSKMFSSSTMPKRQVSSTKVSSSITEDGKYILPRIFILPKIWTLFDILHGNFNCRIQR